LQCGKKRFIAIGGRKYSFADKSEVVCVAKTLMPNVLEEILEELKTTCEDQRHGMGEKRRPNYVEIVMKT